MKTPPKPKNNKKCPNCNRKLYPDVRGGWFCKKCPYTNVPEHRR